MIYKMKINKIQNEEKGSFILKMTGRCYKTLKIEFTSHKRAIIRNKSFPVVKCTQF